MLMLPLFICIFKNIYTNTGNEHIEEAYKKPKSTIVTILTQIEKIPVFKEKVMRRGIGPEPVNNANTVKREPKIIYEEVFIEEQENKDSNSFDEPMLKETQLSIHYKQPDKIDVTSILDGVDSKNDKYLYELGKLEHLEKRVVELKDRLNRLISNFNSKNVNSTCNMSIEDLIKLVYPSVYSRVKEIASYSGVESVLPIIRRKVINQSAVILEFDHPAFITKISTRDKHSTINISFVILDRIQKELILQNDVYDFEVQKELCDKLLLVSSDDITSLPFIIYEIQ